MNPGLLTLTGYYLGGLVALACLCLAMPRHSRLVRLPLPPGILRWVGWSLMILLTTLAISTQGVAFGLVSVLGTLSLSAFTLTGLLTYRPEWIPASLYASGLAVLSLLLGAAFSAW